MVVVLDAPVVEVVEVLEGLVVVVVPPGLVVVVAVPGLVVVVVPDLGAVVVVVVVSDVTYSATRWAARGLGTEVPLGRKSTMYMRPSLAKVIPGENAPLYGLVEVYSAR